MRGADDEDYVRGPGLKHRTTITSHPPQPCPWPACPCTHTAPCVRGWIDGERTTSPCPTCRPAQHEIMCDSTLTRAQKAARLQHNKERR